MASHRLGGNDEVASGGTGNDVHPRDCRDPSPLLIVVYIEKYCEGLNGKPFLRCPSKVTFTKSAMFALGVRDIPPLGRG